MMEWPRGKSKLWERTDGKFSRTKKLTPRIVGVIRRSKKTTDVLAKRYGVTTMTIRNVKRGLTWNQPK
jgi:DNA-binding transcriptional regulator YiaG